MNPPPHWFEWGEEVDLWGHSHADRQVLISSVPSVLYIERAGMDWPFPAPSGTYRVASVDRTRMRITLEWTEDEK